MTGAGLVAPLAVVSVAGGGLTPFIGATATMGVNLSNPGSAPLLVASASLTGDTATFSAVSDSCTSTVLDPGGSCLVSISYSASDALQRTGSLSFVDDAADTPQSLALTARAQPAPSVSIDPDMVQFSSLAVDFGQQPVGSFSSAFLQIRNTEPNLPFFEQTVTINDVRVLGDDNANDFAALGCRGVTLQPQTECQLHLQFHPLSLGGRSATLLVSVSGAPGSGTQQFIALSGTPTTSEPNHTPVPQSGGPYSVMALGSVVLNGSAIDADGDTVRLSWDLDGSGAFATIGGSPTVLAGATTGSRTIVLRACDDQLACATASTTLTVTPAPGGGGGGDGNGGTGGPPSPGDTPELDSLILFGSGLSASIAYILRRRRARTRR